MKTIAATTLALGMALSLPTFADDTMSNQDVASQAKPNDMVNVQLQHSDGTQAPALMQRQDAKKFHDASGIQAKVVGSDDMSNSGMDDSSKDSSSNGGTMDQTKPMDNSAQ